MYWKYKLVHRHETFQTNNEKDINTYMKENNITTDFVFMIDDTKVIDTRINPFKSRLSDCK